MNISVVLTPAEIALLPQADLSETTSVVFDVLRATSTMTTAFENGVAAIYPAKDLAEALAFKKEHPDALLGGERHGEKIAGFDLGNSPLEYDDLAGREIISTTTNGTIALRAVAHSRRVFAGALLNGSSLARRLAREAPARLLLVCAGTGNDFAIEDALGAGALLQSLRDLIPVALDDAGEMLLTLWKAHEGRVFETLANSKNGRRLVGRGRIEEVRWCSRTNGCQMFGVLSGNCLRPEA